MNFYRAIHVIGKHRSIQPVYVWLTSGQANGYTDPDEKVLCFEDWGGQMIWLRLHVGDLDVQEEC